MGTGTGRALPALAAAAGPDGHVLGLDLTPDMLHPARDVGRCGAGARRRAAAAGRADVVLAAGLIQHLPDPGAGLAELAPAAG